MDEKAAPDIDHLRWAIEQRAKIQHTLLALYARAQTIPSEDQSHFEESVFDSLISASFALWRAVFLAEKPVTDRNLRHAQTEFLATVLSTNTVTFADDRRNSAYSLGFYMGAAALHIHSLVEVAKIENPHFSDEEVRGRVVYYIDHTVRNSRRKWEGLHAAVRILYNKLLAIDGELIVDAPLDYDHFL